VNLWNSFHLFRNVSRSDMLLKRKVQNFLNQPENKLVSYKVLIYKIGA